jgi:hypothetical protein
MQPRPSGTGALVTPRIDFAVLVGATVAVALSATALLL